MATDQVLRRTGTTCRRPNCSCGTENSAGSTGLASSDALPTTFFRFPQANWETHNATARVAGIHKAILDSRPRKHDDSVGISGMPLILDFQIPVPRNPSSGDRIRSRTVKSAMGELTKREGLARSWWSGVHRGSIQNPDRVPATPPRGEAQGPPAPRPALKAGAPRDTAGAMLGCLVCLVRGSQGLGLRGDGGAQQEQDHYEPRLEWHPSCQVSIIIPEKRQLTANENGTRPKCDWRIFSRASGALTCPRRIIGDATLASPSALSRPNSAIGRRSTAWIASAVITLRRRWRSAHSSSGACQAL